MVRELERSAMGAEGALVLLSRQVSTLEGKVEAVQARTLERGPYR